MPTINDRKSENLIIELSFAAAKHSKFTLELRFRGFLWLNEIKLVLN